MANYIPLYGLMAATGIIHIAIALGDILGNFIFILNGLGYFALIAYHIIIEDRGFGGTKHLYIIMAYTIITFLAYFIIWIPQEGFSIFTEDPVGMITKLIELIIIGLLYRQLTRKKR